MSVLRWPVRHWRYGAIAVAVLVAAWHVAVRVGDFPMSTLAPGVTVSLTISANDGALLRQEAAAAGTKERWVNLDEISPHLVHATLASEDANFYDHGGVDWWALGRALWLNLRVGRVAYGGSTLTMQLVRNIVHTRRTLWGKSRQVLLAARLERRLSKQQILEHYLNRVYYGHRAWGVEQAARRYFDKSAADLSVGEAAFLAVLPRGPRRYDPFAHFPRALRRRDHILDLMGKRGYVDADQISLAKRTPLRIARHREPSLAPHFVEYVKEQLPWSLRQGSTVATTLDMELQRSVETAVDRHLSKLAWRNVTQSAVVVMRHRDGAILAMVGSRDYYDAERRGAFNGATARLRPGSTLKPFVYGTAIERGDSPATMAFDVVLPRDVHQFYSKDVKSHGFARYREALAGSYNLSAVHTLQKVGVAPVLAKLRAAGLRTIDRDDGDYDWGLAIGHADVRLIDLVAAFSLFGNGGVPVVPRAIGNVEHVGGRLWSPESEARSRVFAPEVAYLIYDILSDSDARKPMFGDRVPMNLPFKVALKTGTTKAYTDNWAVGVTREYTVGVWSGNFDGTPTHQVMSVVGATPLLRAVYAALAARYGDPTAPDRPPGLVRAPVCPLSGQRPGQHCPHRKHETFVTGTVPVETCDWHVHRCGRDGVDYPAEVEHWAKTVGKPMAPVCEEPAFGIEIVSPAAGSRFVLEPHRPANLQRPVLHAIPDDPRTRWFIDGIPAERWQPQPGRHTVTAERMGVRDQVHIEYE